MERRHVVDFSSYWPMMAHALGNSLQARPGGVSHHCRAAILLRRSAVRWLTRLFRRTSHSEGAAALWMYVQCERCGEAIQVRADRRYDVVSEMREPGEPGPAYTLHKDIVGTRCFQRIAVELAFDHRLQVTEHHVTGGTWLTAAAYQAAVAPPAPE